MHTPVVVSVTCIDSSATQKLNADIKCKGFAMYNLLSYKYHNGGREVFC